MTTRSPRARHESRGFTLIELLVYLALLVAGTIVIAGLEFTASRAAFLERALVDLGLQSDDLGTRFKDDVSQAVRVADAATATDMKLDGNKGTLLVLTTAPGGEIRWELESAAKVEKTGPLGPRGGRAPRPSSVRQAGHDAVARRDVQPRREAAPHAERALRAARRDALRLEGRRGVTRSPVVPARGEPDRGGGPMSPAPIGRRRGATFCIIVLLASALLLSIGGAFVDASKNLVTLPASASGTPTRGEALAGAATWARCAVVNGQGAGTTQLKLSKVTVDVELKLAEGGDAYFMEATARTSDRRPEGEGVDRAPRRTLGAHSVRAARGQQRGEGRGGEIPPQIVRAQAEKKFR